MCCYRGFVFLVPSPLSTSTHTHHPPSFIVLGILSRAAVKSQGFLRNPPSFVEGPRLGLNGSVDARAFVLLLWLLGAGGELTGGSSDLSCVFSLDSLDFLRRFDIRSRSLSPAAPRCQTHRFEECDQLAFANAAPQSRSSLRGFACRCVATRRETSLGYSSASRSGRSCLYSISARIVTCFASAPAVAAKLGGFASARLAFEAFSCEAAEMGTYLCGPSKGGDEAERSADTQRGSTKRLRRYRGDRPFARRGIFERHEAGTGQPLPPPTPALQHPPSSSMQQSVPQPPPASSPLTRPRNRQLRRCSPRRWNRRAKL